MQQVPTVQSWLGGGSSLHHTDASMPDHVLKKYILKLKKAVKENFTAPQDHLQSFGKFEVFNYFTIQWKWSRLVHVLSSLEKIKSVEKTIACDIGFVFKTTGYSFTIALTQLVKLRNHFLS